MADVDDLYTDDDDGNDDGGDLRDLRRTANKARKLEKELASLKRELAFTKVPGLDSSDPKIGYFIKGYDGDMTEDAILAAARAAGFVAAPEVTPQAEQQIATDNRIAQVAAGATPVGSLDPTQQLAQAMTDGGADAVLAKVQELGIPIVTY